MSFITKTARRIVRVSGFELLHYRKSSPLYRRRFSNFLAASKTPSEEKTLVSACQPKRTAMSEYGTDEDEELKRAIALSLQGTNQASSSASTTQSGRAAQTIDLSTSPKTSANSIIDLISDSEDDDLDRRPISTIKSALPSKTVNVTKQTQVAQDVNIPLQPSAVSATGSIFATLGIDRKRMEEERLARARKRKASISPPQTTRRGNSPRGLLSANAEGGIRGMKKSILTDLRALSSTTATSASKSSGPASSSFADLANQAVQETTAYRQAQQPIGIGIQFPDGAIKKTWAFGYPRVDDIKIEEVLQKEDLELAILSSFQWSEDWVFSKLKSTTKVILVVQAKSEAQKATIRRNVPSNTSICFPSMAGQINCMHSKLQLLSHPTHLRIVVPTANLVPYDWGESGGVMENMMFLIDLPRLPDHKTVSRSELTPFGKSLQQFLIAKTIPLQIVDSLLKFDFSKTARLAFVHTIGGSNTENSWKTTGHCGLGRAIQELGLATKAPLKMDFLTASLGNLNDKFLRSMYLAAKGDDGTTAQTWNTAALSVNRKKQAESGASAKERETLTNELEDGFRIYFPTHDTVAKSKGGIDAGGTICLSQKYYNGNTFPRALMRDCKSTRKGLLMHSKMIFVRPDTPDISEQKKKAWVYIGSANLSESAWGILRLEKTTKQLKLDARNWECGVVVPVDGPTIAAPHSQSKSIQRASVEEKDSLDAVFGGIVPVPMATPGEEYGNKKPWVMSFDN